MAWRSSGSSHEDMVNCLKRNGLISSGPIERGFRSVDRELFVPTESKDIAYTDQPLRVGTIHISAPHIYCSVLQALELEENTPTSFLNIGSGTGYLSCITAEILGPQSLNYGIEIFEDNVKHSKQAIEKWKKERKKRDSNAKDLHLDIIHGNIFHTSSTEGESMVGFDRIYIGAAVSLSRLSKITKLLSPGGILVGPVDDELVKVVRIGDLTGEVPGSTITAYNGRRYPNPNYVGSGFTQQVLTSVRFAPLVLNPRIETVIPGRVWTPSNQKYYPEAFKEATNQLFMCSNSNVVQPIPPPKKTEDRINFAAMLPKVIWMEILSFTHRKWFDSEETEMSRTKKRLFEEQSNASKAYVAQLDAERRCLVAEKERDVYRLLAKRWQSRLNLVLQQQRQIYLARTQNSLSTAERQASSRVSMAENEMATLFGLDTMMNMDMGESDEDDEILSFGAHDSSDDSSDEEEESVENDTDEEHVVEVSSENEDHQMEDNFQREEEHNVEPQDEISFQQISHHDLNDNDMDSIELYEAHDGDDDPHIDMSSPSKSVSNMTIEVQSRDQIRTVSMGSEDL